MNRLLDKNILITGASKGLRRAMAIVFAKENASGISWIARNTAELNMVSKEIQMRFN